MKQLAPFLKQMAASTVALIVDNDIAKGKKEGRFSHQS